MSFNTSTVRLTEQSCLLVHDLVAQLNSARRFNDDLTVDVGFEIVPVKEDICLEAADGFFVSVGEQGINEQGDLYVAEHVKVHPAL